MYLSHPVRRIREDPHPDEDAGLVVELDDATPEDLHAAVADLGGSVERDLGFDTWLVVVPEVAVDDLCGLDGLARIETDATIEVDPDSRDDGSGEPVDDTDDTLDELRDHLDDE